MDKERYSKGAHTVLDLKYHCVWKTKSSRPVLCGEIGLGLRRILREVATEKRIGIIKGNMGSWS